MVSTTPHVALWGVVAMLALSSGYLVVRLNGSPAPAVGAYAQDRESEVTHLVMAIAMIVMFAKSDAVPVHTWQWFLAVLTLACGGWLVAVIARRSDAPVIAAAGYHTFTAAVMLYAMSGNSHGGREHHNMQHELPTLTTGLTWPPATWALIVLLVFDAVGTIVLSARASTVPAAARIGVFPHVAMDLGTAMMLVAALPK
jgi:membrane protein CcdC involved in cytochrome C biogenesis